MRGLAELLTLLWVVQWTLAVASGSGASFVAACRTRCSKKLTSDGSKASCLKQEECLRCWASCQAFQREHYIREYCKLNKACSAGCRQACDFYLSSAGGRDSASRPAQQLTPTAQRSPEALSAVPAQREAPATAAEARGADGGPLRRLLPSRLPSSRRGKTPDSGLQDNKVRWRPHLSDLRSGSPLVSATVTWRSRGQGAAYLVTWELRSGGLRGHLVSDEPRVNLSLWPDEDYVIQVFSGEDASEPLLVSTKTASPAATERRRRLSVASPSSSGAAAALSAVGAVGLAAAALCCCALAGLECRRRRRRRRSAEHLLPVEEGDRLATNRTVRTVLRPPGKAVAAARLAPLFVISHADR